MPKPRSGRPAPHPSSKEIFDHLREDAQGGVPKNPFAEELAQAAKTLQATYHVAYVQHAPMETRTALAEWNDGKLTVWTGTQNPFGYHGELARAFRLANENVRVIVPDFGGGFGGKHTGEAAIEAARLAQAAGKPVLVRWTREEEFTWAYFRPAAVIEVEASLDAKGALTSWHFININSGGAAVDTPYRAGKARCRSVCIELAVAPGLLSRAGRHGQQLRPRMLSWTNWRPRPAPIRSSSAWPTSRTRACAPCWKRRRKRFNWRERVKQKAARRRRRPGLRHGKGLLRGGLRGDRGGPRAGQNHGAARVRGLRVRRRGEPRQSHWPRCKAASSWAWARRCARRCGSPRARCATPPSAGIWCRALRTCRNSTSTCSNRPDLPSAGGGETPIIAIAPAIANAVFHATGRRIREMPIRLRAAREA